MQLPYLKTHISLTSSAQVRDICEPLFNHFGLKLFVFNRSYTHNGFALFSHPEWTDFFFREDYINRLSFTGLKSHEKFLDYKFILTSTFPENKMLKNLRDYFRIDHGIIVCKYYEDYCEWCTFAADADRPEIINFYLNNFDYLIRFIEYFKYKSAKLIEIAAKKPFFFPEVVKDQKIYLKGEVAKLLFDNTKKEKFFYETKLNKRDLIVHGKKVHLTARELDCLYYLKQGDSAKVTAQKLKISPRTVEFHLLEIRSKLHCNSKTNLLTMIGDQMDFYIPLF